MRLRPVVVVLVGVTCMLFASPAWAVRPFITDDARVVGGRLAQMESWARIDHAAFQQWILLAFGPVEPLELTVGGLYGVSYGEGPPRFSVAGPILQAKLLLRETRSNQLPGVAIAGGTVAPLGLGAFAAKSWEGFTYMALTQSFFRDGLLLHGNGGVFLSSGGPSFSIKPTWGLGTQIRTIAGLHIVAEVFSGDPYARSSGGAVQAGFRYIFSDLVQVDATLGSGVWGEPALPIWGTMGIRLVTAPLWGASR